MAARKTGARTKAASRRRTTARERRVMARAVAHGRRQAREVLERRRPAAMARASAASPGTVVAEGDSWFDYPFHDVLERLEDVFSYRVESVAHKGDTAEQMAYDPTQLEKLARLFERLTRPPRAILLSGGGNDIAGDELAVLLNHASAGLGDLNDNVLAGVVDERLRFALTSVIAGVTRLARDRFGRVVPVVVHGYAYPVPDGRGFAGGFWILPGPWLEPGFRQKGYMSPNRRPEELARCARIMERLIDRFNAMVASIAGASGLEHVRYLDLRSLLSNDVPGYKRDWKDELHPTERGFGAVAERFHELILTFPQPA